MSFRSRMKAKRTKLRTMHNKQDPEGRKQIFPTIFLKKDIPAGVEFFRPPEGRAMFDIIPFEAGPDTPIHSDVEEGDLAYKLDVMVHYDIGSMKKPFVCPKENYGEPCPICAFRDAQRLPTEEWKKLKPKHRVIYLVWVHDDSRKEEKKGIQIMDMAHFNSEEKFLEVARLPRGGGYVNYGDHEDGKTMVFTRKGTGARNTQYIGHSLIDREVKIPDRILDKTFSIDQIIEMRPEISDIEEAFMGMKDSIKLDENNSPLDDTPSMGDDWDDTGRDRKRTTSRSSGRSRSSKTSGRSSNRKTKTEKKSTTRTRSRRR